MTKDFAGATFTLLGRPAAGKGVQSDLLKHFLEARGYRDIILLKIGSFFRKIQYEETVIGRWVKSSLTKGVLFPRWLAVNLFLEELRPALLRDDQIIIVDGFPRRLDEAKDLDDILDKLGRRPVVPIYLEISEAEVRRRLVKRARSDQNEEAMTNRLTWFKTDVLPVLEYWEERLVTIDGLGTVEAVFQRMIKALDKIVS